MKSQKAKELLDKKVYHDSQIEYECVLYSWAVDAVEIAEKELTEKAVDAFIESCEYKDDWCCGAREYHGAILTKPDICKGKECQSVKKFINQLNQ